MAGSPLDQFKIKKIIDIDLFGQDISLTNSGCALILASTIASVYLIMAMRKYTLIPSRLQLTVELIYGVIFDLVNQMIGRKGHPYVPIMFSIFLFILLCNLVGLLPYNFTATSHMAVTFSLASIVFLTITIVGFTLHGIGFLKLFLPHGTPLWLAPLMIVIELFAFLTKPVTLSIRLTANMVAGHILIKLIVGFIVSLTLVLKILPIPVVIILTGFEIFVAILQSYIFTLLSCAYLNDAVNLH